MTDYTIFEIAALKEGNRQLREENTRLVKQGKRLADELATALRAVDALDTRVQKLEEELREIVDVHEEVPAAPWVPCDSEEDEDNPPWVPCEDDDD